MPRLFAVHAVGPDKPGNLAAIAQRLLTHEANVAESQVAILRGYTMMTLLVTAGDDVDEPALRADLDADAAALGLAAITLTPLPAGMLTTVREPSHLVSFYGQDRPGMLAGVASGLTDASINVIELQSRLIDGDGNGNAPLQVMLMEVAVPPELDGARFDGIVRELAREQGIEVALAPLAED